MTQLPGLAGEIENTIGLDAAVRLLKTRGGTDIEIPKRAAGTYLEGLIGVEATSGLIKRFGHGRLSLPCSHMRGFKAEQGRRKALAQQLLRENRSQREVALACDLHLRTVQRYAAELSRPSDQGELPF